MSPPSILPVGPSLASATQAPDAPKPAAPDAQPAKPEGAPAVDTEAPKTVEEILEGTTPGRETSGRTDQFVKPGGVGQANDDFDSMAPSGVKPIGTGMGAGGRVGVLPSGQTVVVRPSSTADNAPTLEIQGEKRTTKIRYVTKGEPK